MDRTCRSFVLLAFAVAALVASPHIAHACGCFTPPNPTVPVVQAGERIVFAAWDGQVTAHIQIQYAGDASDFGWLVPLPSLPTLQLGTDELFAQLSQRTDPDYQLEYVAGDACPNQGPRYGNGSDMASAYASDLGVASDGGVGPSGPLVVAASIGPYDYAVLKADDKSAMLDWLTTNHYFVPVGTDDVVAPYLHPGAFFLALKLHSGQSAGNLQPIVLQYASDLPMIPIVLTSVGAKPHMGIAVWILGDARAIPRNYYHTVLNDAALDWQGGSGNYFDVLTRAVAEAPGKHAFVTEFAGASAIMQGALDYTGRYGDLAALAQIADAGAYLDYLRANGFYFSSALVAILARYFPLPAGAQLLDPATYYYNYDYYTNLYGPITAPFDPAALTDEITTRVVQPTRDAAQLFSTFPYVTRLYTALSPEDMTRDPAFSFNPFLPDVALHHVATLRYFCDSDGESYDAALTTEEQFAIFYPHGEFSPPPVMPFSLRTEILREEGAPEVVVDNRELITSILDGTTSGNGGNGPIGRGDGGTSSLAGANRGCSVEPGIAGGRWMQCVALGVGLLGLVGLLRRSRRRRG